MSKLICKQCTTANPEDHHYCHQCGSSLAKSCEFCHFQNQGAAHFCGGCGRPFGDEGTSANPVGLAIAKDNETIPTDSERRQVTVLFCDLVGYTGLSEILDPEDLRSLIRNYQSITTRAIEKRRGVVSRYVGDGIQAHFGYPCAHEDDAAQAVHAALEIIDAMEKWKDQPLQHITGKLRVRLGVATGLVVVGDLIGCGESEQKPVVGITPNLAARLQQLAGENQVVISPETQRLVSNDFHLNSIGRIALKGISEPLEAWRVSAVRNRANKLRRMLLNAISPLVGRTKELQALKDSWAMTLADRGQVVLIKGDAGIGKSRLIQAIKSAVQEQQPIPVTYQCSPLHQSNTLYPFLQQLQFARHMVETHSRSSGKPISQKILKATARRVEIALPLFENILVLPETSGPAGENIDSHRKKQDLFNGLIAIMDSVQGSESALIIFEDIHWIDPTSMELLDLMIRNVHRCRIMIVVSCRKPFYEEWAALDNATHLKLSRLNNEGAVELAGHTDAAKRLSAHQLDFICNRSDGIPLYIEELTKSFLETDAPSPLWRTINALSNAHPVPMTLQDLLMARLDRLGRAKQIAQIAAVIGRQFSLRLLKKLSTDSVFEIKRQIRKLLEAGIVTLQDNDSQIRYQFRHALIQDAAYQSLLKSRRSEIHLQIALQYADNPEFSKERFPELLAHHFNQAGRDPEAIHWFTVASQKNLVQAAYREAGENAAKGLALLQALEFDDTRQKAELHLQLIHGIANRAIRGFSASETKQSFGTAVRLSQALGDNQKLVEALNGLFGCHYVRGDLYKALQIANRVTDIAIISGKHLSREIGHYMLGAVNFWHGQYAHAAYRLKMGLLPDSQSDGQRIDLYPASLAILCWTYWLQGKIDQGIEAGDEAVAKSRDYGKPFSLATALFWRGVVALYCNDLTLCRDLCVEMRALAKQHGLTYVIAVSHLLLGSVDGRSGNPAGGQHTIDTGLADLQDLYAGLGRPWALSLAVENHLLRGQSDRAGELLTPAIDRCNRSQEKHWLPELLRLQARILTEHQQHAEAQVLLNRAVRIAQLQHAPALILRVAMDQHRLCQTAPQRSRCSVNLAGAYGLFANGFETHDLQEARAMLAGEENLSGRRTR